MDDPRFDQLFDQHIRARMAMQRAIQETGRPLFAGHPVILAAAKAIHDLLAVVELENRYPSCPDCYGTGVDGGFEQETGVARLDMCLRCIGYGYNGPYSDYRMEEIWPGSSAD